MSWNSFSRLEKKIDKSQMLEQKSFTTSASPLSVTMVPSLFFHLDSTNDRKINKDWNMTVINTVNASGIGTLQSLLHFRKTICFNLFMRKRNAISNLFLHNFFVIAHSTVFGKIIFLLLVLQLACYILISGQLFALADDRILKSKCLPYLRVKRIVMSGEERSFWEAAFIWTKSLIINHWLSIGKRFLEKLRGNILWNFQISKFQLIALLSKKEDLVIL